jgi:SAM-dependent methyltransferase
VSVRPLLKGMATYLPGANKLLLSKGTGGTTSARYCYSAWLRHISWAHENALSTRPEVVAELGPGDSLGIGLAALLSGATTYYALDVVEDAITRRNTEILDELVELFRRRQGIPGEKEFPELKPYLKSYVFPRHILTDERLGECLSEERVEFIRRALEDPSDSLGGMIEIQYLVPWFDSGILESKAGSVDMIYSQAVLEHVDDLAGTYRAMWQLLRPNGVVSHQIDFRSHGTAKQWNGHWAYSEPLWKLMRGRRPYLLNRQPHSTHIDLLREHGFEVVCDITVRDPTGIRSKQLAREFRGMSDEDLTTSGAFVQAVKKTGGVSRP